MNIFYRLFPPLLLAILFSSSVGAEEVVKTGWWSQYDEGPTLAQMAYHDFSIDDAEGFIAVLNCDRVGEYAWIRVNDSDWIRTRVFDCLGSNGNPSWWRNNHILGEIDYYTAVKHGVEGQGGVRAHLAFESDLQNLSDDEISAWAIPIDARSDDGERINNGVIEPESLGSSVLDDLNTIGDVSSPVVTEGNIESDTESLSIVFPTNPIGGVFDFQPDLFFVGPTLAIEDAATSPLACPLVLVCSAEVQIVDRWWNVDLYANSRNFSHE
jgi:hypothetical protein